MLISPTFLCTMSDFSRFVALILRCRLQSVHFHLLIPKDTFAIIETKIPLTHLSDPIVVLFFTHRTPRNFV